MACTALFRESDMAVLKPVQNFLNDFNDIYNIYIYCTYSTVIYINFKF